MCRQENLFRFDYHKSEPNRQETHPDHHFAMTDNSLNLHALADRFDAAWRLGERPSLSGYLDDVEDSQRLNATLSVSQSLTQDWRLVGGYTYSQAEDETDGTTTSNTVFVGISRNFDWRW